MTKKEIGAALVKARKKQTAYQVCKKSGLTYQQLAKMESGTSNYTIDSLIKLCGILGVTINLK